MHRQSLCAKKASGAFAPPVVLEVAFGSSAAGGLLARVGGLLGSERPLAGSHLRGSGQVRCGCGCWLCCGSLSFWLCFGSLSCWLCFGTLSCWLCFVTLSCWLCFDTLSCWLVLLVGRQDLAGQLLRHPLEQSCRVRLGFRDDFHSGREGGPGGCSVARLGGCSPNGSPSSGTFRRLAAQSLIERGFIPDASPILAPPQLRPQPVGRVLESDSNTKLCHIPERCCDGERS